MNEKKKKKDNKQDKKKVDKVETKSGNVKGGKKDRYSQEKKERSDANAIKSVFTVNTSPDFMPDLRPPSGHRRADQTSVLKNK